MHCWRVLLTILLLGTALAEELNNDEASLESYNRQPRTIKQKLCFKYGLCENQGGYHGNQGHQGGHQGGYQHGYPGYPINIAISQSQSSSNGADGGNSHGYYPNNHQYNGGYDNFNHGYGGYNNHGYKKHPYYQRPGYFGNGLGSYNNQFNGNYYGGQGQGPHGGYGFQRPFYDEQESSEENEHDGGFGYARSLAVASSKA